MVKMGTVWERTAEFLTDNLTAIVPVALFAFFAPFSIQSSLAQVWNDAIPGLTLALGLVSLTFSILILWGWLTIVAMALGLDDGRSAGSIAAQRLAPALAVWVAIFLAIVVVPGIAILFMAGAGGETAMRGVATAAGGVGDIADLARRGVILYALAIAVPLLWLMSRLILVSPVIVQEHKWFAAISRSFALTRGHALAIVGVLILYILVSLVASLATRVVFGSIFHLIAGPQEGLSLANVLTSVMVAAVQTAFEVIGAIFTAKLYLALVAERGRAAGA